MKKKISNRDYSIDLIRIIGCIMIVAMHSPLPTDAAPGPFLTALSYFTAPAIGLFFMSSGALLLPVKTDYFTFIKTRLTKIVLPTLFWSLVYIGVNAYIYGTSQNMWQLMLSLPLSNVGSGVLWFAYTLIGLYFLAPILSAWIEKASVREIEMVLILWAISLCYPLLEFGLTINSTTTGILYYFTGYAGYFLMGYYLKHYSHRLPLIIPSALSVAGIVLIIILESEGIEYDFYRLFWYESIFIAALCCCVWMLIHAMAKKAEAYIERSPIATRILVHISSMSFGIYFMQILIMRFVIWNLGWIKDIANYYIQTIAIAVSTFAICLVISHIISKTPGIRVLVGAKATHSPAMPSTKKQQEELTGEI